MEEGLEKDRVQIKCIGKDQGMVQRKVGRRYDAMVVRRREYRMYQRKDWRKDGPRLDDMVQRRRG